MKLSIILPVYNVEKYINACIESLYLQEFDESEFEIILVNDGTPDKSIEVTALLRQKHSNIKIINQPNQGVSVARNNGLKEAIGKYILFIDSDDLILPKTLNSFYELANNHTLDILVGDYIKMNNSEIELLAKNKYHIQKKALPASGITNGKKYFVDFYDQLAGYSCINLYKKEFLEKHNICFRTDIAFAEDTLFTTSAFLFAERVERISKVFYIYRQHNTSVMSSISIDKLLTFNSSIAGIATLKKIFAPLPNECEKKLEECVFSMLSTQLWYLSHYQALVKKRMQAINDLKKKVPGLLFYGNLKQLFVSLCYRMIPSIYIYIRYLLASKKY